jgi:gamma-glutamylcyclotransferase (GGCT)/AIG2-like uncharacterized protein YtfP
MAYLNLFVYGTLMQGFRANSFIPKNSVMSFGKIVGRLYHYSAGYPIVKIPKSKDTVEGSMDYEKDLSIQENKNGISTTLEKVDGFDFVYGELYEIPYTEEVLERFDSYEGFTGNFKTSLYKRTLVPVQLGDGSCKFAWVYNMDNIPINTVYIPSGYWRNCFLDDEQEINI